MSVGADQIKSDDKKEVNTNTKPIIDTPQPIHPAPLVSQQSSSQNSLQVTHETVRHNQKTLAELYYVDAKRNYLINKREISHLKKKKKILDKETDSVYFAEKESVNNELFNKLKEKDTLKQEYRIKRKERKGMFSKKRSN
ncbi:Two tm domain protein [Entamoeba marina]